VRVAPRLVGVGVGTAAPGFYRPYYSFRPRVSLGFGLWAGYPVVYPSFGYYGAYPYGYGYDPYYDPYAYAAPYPGYPTSSPPPAYGGYGAAAPGTYAPGTYGTQPGGSIGVQPGGGGQQGAMTTGGLSFEITPATAEVLIDGNAVGVVSSFTPTSQPLTLAPGRHHIEIRAPGYETLAFDTDVVAGQVIPYQGTMQPQR
jgi:hypothetical protein